MKERRCDEYDNRQKKVQESQHRQMIGRRQIRRQIFPGRCTDERTMDDTDKMTDKGKTSTRQTVTDRRTYRKREGQWMDYERFFFFFFQRNSDCRTKS